MRGGIWVLNIFAALWVVAGILSNHLPIWLAVIPIAVSGGLLLWASRQPVGTGAPVAGDHVGRVVGIATAVEGVALFLVANILINLHLPTAVIPAAVIIVGLHFLPLARWIPVLLYYRTGGALIAVGALGLLLPPSDRAMATGTAAALVLWASGIMLVRRRRS
jgi:hypothetical protein